MFIKAQLSLNAGKRKFINILDGDCSHKHMPKFKYLLDKYSDNSGSCNVFCGDMAEFVDSEFIK
jgi:hypothetical protein